MAFAGFTSVVAVFGNRGGRGWSERESVYLRLLVDYSISTLLTAVLPLILWNSGLIEATAWLVASTAKAIQIVVYQLVRFRSFHKQRGNFGPMWGF